ncbi:MAG: VCBS repeat-containing protein, partial [Deltaproteobacteria bacterium]|nr:VCBS repeat-containing protein [Deltaproteobacteria bacterium]
SVGAAIMISGCKGGDSAAKNDQTIESAQKTDVKKNDAVSDKADGKKSNGKALLVALSTFKKDDNGKYVIPDKGELQILTPSDNGWKSEMIKDSESNVYHKALQYKDEGILSIGANEAMLKLWNQNDSKWSSKTLWHTTFGGKQNRLRDFEKADFDGDGNEDLAIATHDQGVVAVVWNRGGKWVPEEIDRQADMFVHEIEIGDLDGNGKLEIYATPSKPNTASGVEQGGGIIRFAWNGEKFEKSEVVHYDKRHIKEVLVADVDGDGKPELYASVEAQMGEGFKIEVPVDIVRFDYIDGKFVSKKVVQLAGERFCRFLTAGDIDGDGKKELVASAFSTGIHVIKQTGEGSYSDTVIDKESGGFEHATYMADIDGDGKLELYAADDNHGSINQYVYDGKKYVKTTINKRLVPKSAMVWNITTANL